MFLRKYTKPQNECIYGICILFYQLNAIEMKIKTTKKQIVLQEEDDFTIA